MKITTKNTLAVLAAILFFSLIQGVSAQAGVNATETTNITVTVSAVTMIDIAPASFSYVVNPGQECGLGISHGVCNETVNNYYALQVQNIGSWNVTKIWFNVTQDPQSPFGVGSAQYFDPGNTVALSTNETTDDFFFVDRKEYPEIRSVVYLRDPDGVMPANLTKFKYGRFHNASREFFYMIQNTTKNDCDVTEVGWIRIGRVARTTIDIGSTDFYNGPSVNYDQINLTKRTLAGYTDYACGNITVGPLAGYAVAVENSTCAVRFAKWNKDFPFDVGFANYSFNGILTPGDSLAKKIGVMIPYGTYTSTKTGLLTAIAIGAP